jgi:hypothetical protein
MPGVEGTDLDEATRPSARDAVVIAKSDPLKAELIVPVGDDQDGSRWAKL